MRTPIEAIADLEVSARYLYKLHQQRKPFALQGDSRTKKSNALKDSSCLRANSGGVPSCLPLFNPNRGAARTKQLGLWYDWNQTITIQRWRAHERLAQHFLMCPSEPASAMPFYFQTHDAPAPRSLEADHARNPQVGRARRARLAAPCLGKARKLFLILCTEEECRDAELAEGWIRMTEARYAAAGIPLPPELIQIRAQLFDRYAQLFRPRKLLCRACLGIRYGETRT